jgi:hypothetical protein
VLSFVKHASWQVACNLADSAKQAATNGMIRNARKGERFIKVANGRIVVFIMRRALQKSGPFVEHNLRKALATSAVLFCGSAKDRFQFLNAVVAIVQIPANA